MTFLCILILSVFTQVPLSHGIWVVCKFVEWSTIPWVESGIDSHVNILGASYKADVLQNNLLKNDQPLVVPFTTSYAIELQCKCWYKTFTKLAIYYVIALGGNVLFLPSFLELTILVYYSIQVCDGILVHPILIDTTESVVSGHGGKYLEVAIAC